MTKDDIIKIWDRFESSLRAKCIPISSIDLYRKYLEEISEFIADKTNKALWLALPQIWHLVRWYACRFGDKVEVFINPKISLRWHKKIWEESCLSEPWVEKIVFRNEAITVKYTNLDWELKELKLAWIYARIAQHEQDHLDGILLVDK